MFFVVRSNDSFNFPLGLIKYIAIVTQIASHWQGPILLSIVVPAVADGLFGLRGSERADELFTPSPHHTRPPPLFSVPNKLYGFCGR